MNQPHYLVAGLGQTGRSIAAFLKRRHLPFSVFDTRQQIAGLTSFKEDFPDVTIYLETLPTYIYSQLTTIIASPGVVFSFDVLQNVQQYEIPIIGDIECLAREITAPVIAITGTNGKSTVTTLVGEMAKAAGFSVAVAGNIGLPVLDLLDNDQQYDLWVLELSSFQLDLLYSLAPIAATILNISPDHLDRHQTMAAYVTAKQHIYHNARHCIYNRQDEATYPPITSKNVLTSFGLDTLPLLPSDTGNDWGLIEQFGKIYLAQGKTIVFAVDDLRIKGQQNWQNALAACALAASIGIAHSSMIAVLQTFIGLPHRCQWIRNLNGVDWINDSKGTNIGATVSAISGIGQTTIGKIVLLAGGLGKGADFTDLTTVVADFCQAVILIGQDADKIEQALQGICPILRAPSLEEAVLLAASQARPRDVVLLSPACASQDMFRDFNHRGDVFVTLVNKL